MPGDPFRHLRSVGLLHLNHDRFLNLIFGFQPGPHVGRLLRSGQPYRANHNCRRGGVFRSDYGRCLRYDVHVVLLLDVVFMKEIILPVLRLIRLALFVRWTDPRTNRKPSRISVWWSDTIHWFKTG